MLECGQSNQQMKRTITESLSFFNCFSRLSRHCTQKWREQEDVARPSSGLHDTYAEKHSFSKPDLIIATWEVQKKNSAWISVSCLNLLSTQHIKRKTALQNHLAEFDGEGSRLRFEQEHGQTDGWNGQKFSSDDNAAGIASLVPGVKNLRLRNGLEFDRAQLVYLGGSCTNGLYNTSEPIYRPSRPIHLNVHIEFILGMVGKGALVCCMT